MRHSRGSPAAIQRAKDAGPGWEATPISQRIAVLRRFQESLLAQRDDVARLTCREAGKPRPKPYDRSPVVLDAVEFCIRNITLSCETALLFMPISL